MQQHNKGNYHYWGKIGKEVYISRVTMDSSEGQLGCTVQLYQFPLRPAFAMTMHNL